MAARGIGPRRGRAGRSSSATSRRPNELSPVEMIVANLAACSAMDVQSIAAKKRQAIERYEVHGRRAPARRVPAGPDRGDGHPRGVGARTISEAAIRRAIELSATKYCPVNAMVSAGATVVHHRYRIHCRRRAAMRRGRGHRDRSVPPARRRRLGGRPSGSGSAPRRSRRAGPGRGSRCGSRRPAPTSAGSTAGSPGSSRSRPGASGALATARAKTQPSVGDPSAKATSDRISAMLPSTWAKRGGYSCSGSVGPSSTTLTIRRQTAP